MKTYIFLADGFEILETFAPVDVLKRCGADVITVSTEKDLLVASSQKNIVKADVMLSDIDYKTADLVIIPGGYPGYVNLRENKEVVDIVKYFLDNFEIDEIFFSKIKDSVEVKEAVEPLYLPNIEDYGYKMADKKDYEEFVAYVYKK